MILANFHQLQTFLWTTRFLGVAFLFCNIGRIQNTRAVPLRSWLGDGAKWAKLAIWAKWNTVIFLTRAAGPREWNTAILCLRKVTMPGLGALTKTYTSAQMCSK